MAHAQFLSGDEVAAAHSFQTWLKLNPTDPDAAMMRTPVARALETAKTYDLDNLWRNTPGHTGDRSAAPHVAPGVVLTRTRHH